MLKQSQVPVILVIKKQPLSGGCVLKQRSVGKVQLKTWQPPSGGCVLKPALERAKESVDDAATFGWLRVETKLNKFE